MLGERTAEEIKMAIGSAFPAPDEPHAEIRGRDLVSGLPKTIVVSAEEIRKAHRGAGQRDHRRGQDHARQVPARAVRRHHGPRHRHHRRRRAAQGPRRAAAPRDRHADPHHRPPAGLGGDGVRQVRRGVRGAAAGAHLRAAALRGSGRRVAAADEQGTDEQGHPSHPGAARAAARHLRQPRSRIDHRGGDDSPLDGVRGAPPRPSSARSSRWPPRSPARSATPSTASPASATTPTRSTGSAGATRS